MWLRVISEQLSMRFFSFLLKILTFSVILTLQLEQVQASQAGQIPENQAQESNHLPVNQLSDDEFQLSQAQPKNSEDNSSISSSSEAKVKPLNNNYDFPVAVIRSHPGITVNFFNREMRPRFLSKSCYGDSCAGLYSELDLVGLTPAINDFFGYMNWPLLDQDKIHRAQDDTYYVDDYPLGKLMITTAACETKSSNDGLSQLNIIPSSKSEPEASVNYRCIATINVMSSEEEPVSNSITVEQMMAPEPSVIAQP
jgi:hypothetical protein